MVDIKITTMRQRMVDGEPFRHDDRGLRAAQEVAEERCRAFNDAASTERPLKLANLVAELGEETLVRAPLHVEFGVRVKIGARCVIGPGLVVQDHGDVTIGDDVQIGAGVQLLTLTLPVQAAPRRDKWAAASPVTVGDNVSLGAGVIVNPGVTIGNDTVVGAGSVVIDDLPAGVLAVGNPAKVIGKVG
ncbi:DapH/DapD/GlmU-related protein [Nocardioides alcanivorans]|uniref:DapH/DapD/GlmU-related protein n=1 Tax=Nocardioides alcanivorans TaxID=2897352 RepID=UPI001F1D278A|nr:DapH/DapD/GlmU-related protein [Nocardioides alcanivorans]